MKALLILLLAVIPMLPAAPADTKSGEVLTLPFSSPTLSINEEAEREMLELVNAEREAAGLHPLALDETITAVARLHSFDMWERQYFAHTTPDGKTPFDRMEDGAVTFRNAGENLALASNLSRAHKGLMESEGHRRNILDPSFTRIGIGVVSGGIYGTMFTQNFAD